MQLVAFYKLIILCITLILSSCTGVPDDIQPVQDFKLNKYLGMWYEIAHFDHSFEKGLTNVTANYSLRDDEGVNVINKGYDPEKGEWDTAEGVAYFV